MRILLVGALVGSMVHGQTKVDLKNQVKNVDFSAAADVRPFPVGTALPATCATGSMFFKSNQPAGANIYGCAAPNTWVLQSGGNSSPGGNTGIEIPLGVEKTGATLTIGLRCSPTNPCLAAIGTVTNVYLSKATVSVSSGTGTAFFYVDRSGQRTAGVATASAPNIACTGCQVVTSITQFPPDSLPLAIWHATAGKWDSTGTDQRAILKTGAPIAAGKNVTVSSTGSTLLISAFLSQLASGDQDECNANKRGTIWYTPGGVGMKDQVDVCVKNAAGLYAWRSLY